MRQVLFSALKCTFAAAVMGLGVFYIHSNWLTTRASEGLLGTIINLAFLILIGMILYFAVTRILGCRELASIREMLPSIFRKKR
jgi:hypothetical protein